MVTEELICPTCGQILLNYKKKFKPVRLVKIPKIVGRMFKYV